MGSPLDPVTAEDFVDVLERNVVPELSLKITIWKCHVDDTIAYVKPDAIYYVPSFSNYFNTRIKFTYETCFTRCIANTKG